MSVRIIPLFDHTPSHIIILCQAVTGSTTRAITSPANATNRVRKTMQVTVKSWNTIAEEGNVSVIVTEAVISSDNHSGKPHSGC